MKVRFGKIASREDRIVGKDFLAASKRFLSTDEDIPFHLIFQKIWPNLGFAVSGKKRFIFEVDGHRFADNSLVVADDSHVSRAGENLRIFVALD